MRTPRGLRLPAADVSTHWRVRHGEAYGAPPQARWNIAVEHVSFLRPEGTPAGASRVAEGSVQVEVLFD
jgi:hypothetical protein